MIDIREHGGIFGGGKIGKLSISDDILYEDNTIREGDFSKTEKTLCTITFTIAGECRLKPNLYFQWYNAWGSYGFLKYFIYKNNMLIKTFSEGEGQIVNHGAGRSGGSNNIDILYDINVNKGDIIKITGTGYSTPHASSKSQMRSLKILGVIKSNIKNIATVV